MYFTIQILLYCSWLKHLKKITYEIFSIKDGVTALEINLFLATIYIKNAYCYRFVKNTILKVIEKSSHIEVFQKMKTFNVNNLEKLTSV